VEAGCAGQFFFPRLQTGITISAMESLAIYFVLGVVFPGAAFAAYWLRRRWQGRAAEGWPMTNGTVEQRYVAGEKRMAIATIAYSYSVDGEYFAGFCEQAFPVEELAEKFIDRFPKDAKILVRYQPGKPSRSVLREEDQSLHSGSALR
jgi:hypothetical protein